MTNIKSRFLQIASNKGISYEKFLSELDVSYSGFKGKQKETGISSDVIVRLKTIHPEVDLDWLVMGTEQNAFSNLVNDSENAYKKQSSKNVDFEQYKIITDKKIAELEDKLNVFTRLKSVDLKAIEMLINLIENARV